VDADPASAQLPLRLAALCPKPYGFIQKLYNPHRIKGPLKRANPQKGPGIDPRWVEISWDEALDIVAEKLKAIRDKNSRRLSTTYSSPAERGLKGTWEPFFKVFGPTQALRGGSSIRCGLGMHSFGQYIHGAFRCYADLEYCNYLLLLGTNPFASWGVQQSSLLLDARSRGMKMVVVDPVLSSTSAIADEWLPIKPDTDGAFLLALIHVIVNELGIYDVEFLKSMTNSPYLVGPDGYFVRDKATGKVLVWDPVEDRAKAYDDESIKDLSLEGKYTIEGAECRPAFEVLKEHARQYTPEWASAITEIAPDTIRRIAKEYVDHAQIGSTIQIDGVTLPYRPVHIHIGRPLEASRTSFQSLMAQHILVILVGALETVGGHRGGSTQPLKIGGYHCLGTPEGPDGMIESLIRPFNWPPAQYDGWDVLLPMITPHPHMDHLTYLNLVNPPPNFPVPPPPEMHLKWRDNPPASVGDPKIVLGALMKIPFIVSIAYVQDEVTELADVVLPDHTELERFELINGVWHSGTTKKFRGTLLRQAVVEPVHNTRDIADIFTELADRIGILSEYNKAANEYLKLTPPYQLEPDKKYAWIDIVNRQCLSATEGAHDLEWFKEHCAIQKPLPVQAQYDVHLQMKARKLRHPIPYFELAKKAGEELARNLASVGIDWWSTDEYVPLPIYVPSVLDQVPPEYDLYVTTRRLTQIGWGTDVDVPWVLEITELFPGQPDILMNVEAARARGIKDGDEVWVESEVGRVKQRVKLSQGLRPDTVVIAGQFGHWSTPVAKDKGWVSLTALTPIKHSWTDPVCGTMQAVIKAKVYKAGGHDD